MDLIEHIEKSLHWADLEVSKLRQDVLDIPGISSNKVKMFLNNLCSLPNSTYLEIGVYRGSTFCSAIYGNDVKAIGIDNWSAPFITPANPTHKMNSVYKQRTENPKDEFLNNVKKYGKVESIKVFRANYLDFDYTTIPQVDIIFYDGETKFFDRYNIMKKLISVMKNECIVIFDDWNWENDKALQSIKDSGLFIKYQKNIYTTGEDSKNYWNGLGIFVLQK